MKKLLFSILIFTLVSGILVAQDIVTRTSPMRTPEELAQKQTERLQRDLRLTHEQCDTIYKVHLKYAKMRKGGESREEVALRMRKMSEELVPLLTNEQKIRYRQFLSEIGPKRQNSPRIRTAEATETLDE